LRRPWIPCLLAAAALALAPPPAAAGSLGDDAFIDSFIPVDAAALATIGAALPEVPNAGLCLADDAYEPALVLDAEGTVQVTFVWEGSDRRNTLGYFTYTSAPLTIVDRQLVFPNASLPDKPGQGVLATGETVTLRDASGFIRTFPAGTKIGFFLVNDGAKKSKAVKQWDAPTAELPFADPAANGDEAGGLFTTLDALNPEQAVGRADVSRHAVLVPVPGLLPVEGETLLLGFEQTDRTDPRCDHDFNDLIVAVTTPDADTSALPDLPTGDPDGDGASGTDDAWPDDPLRAALTRVPASGFQLLALDDGYPAAGDGDGNDAVLAWAFSLVTDGDGDVRDVLGELHLLARSADTDHALGLHLPGLPDGSAGGLRVERFTGPADEPGVQEPLVMLADLISEQDKRIETLLPSTATALPAPEGALGVNTGEGELVPAASTRLRLTISPPVDPETLGPAPWDLYWLVDTTAGTADVHLSGEPGFADRPAGLPDESGAGAFQDDLDRPWLLVLPWVDGFPEEGADLSKSFPKLLKWAASHGLDKPTWYAKSRENTLGPGLDELLVDRPWTLGLLPP
jgi:LruC domain-containing protein